MLVTWFIHCESSEDVVVQNCDLTSMPAHSTNMGIQYAGDIRGHKRDRQAATTGTLTTDIT